MLAEIKDLTEQGGRLKQTAESLSAENARLAVKHSEDQRRLLDAGEFEHENASLKRKIELSRLYGHLTGSWLAA